MRACRKVKVKPRTEKRLTNPTFIGFTRVMQLDTILGMSPALFNGGLLLVNINHMMDTKDYKILHSIVLE